MRYRPGHSLTEYGSIVGLIVILAISAVMLLGSSVSNIFTQLDGNLKSSPESGGGDVLTAYTSMDFGKSAVPTPNSVASAGSNAGAASSGDGAVPSLQLSNTSSGGTNATSIEGQRAPATLEGSSFATMSLAQQMEKLTAQESDASLKAIFDKMTYYTYYLSGTEATYAKVKEFAPENAGGLLGLGLVGDYNQGGMLSDITIFRDQISQLMKQIPASNLSPSAQQMLALAQDAIANTKTFDAEINRVAGSDGKASQSQFQWAYGSSILSPVTSSKQSYESKVSYTDLKSKVSTSLANNSAVHNAAVQNTMVDSTQMDTVSSQQ